MLNGHTKLYIFEIIAYTRGKLWIPLSVSMLQLDWQCCGRLQATKFWFALTSVDLMIYLLKKHASVSFPLNDLLLSF